MRVWLYQAVFTLALLFASAAGQRAAASPQQTKLSALTDSRRQAIVSPASLQTLAMAAAGHKPRRGHGPPPLACLFPTWRGLTAPTSQRPPLLQLADRFLPGVLRLVHAPRAPPPLSSPV